MNSVFSIGAIALCLLTIVDAGPNLTPDVRNFTIEMGYVGELTEVQDGCITNGTHNLLRFDFLSQNIGNADFIAGKPLGRPDLFYYHLSHHHFHMREFNQYKLIASTGNFASTGNLIIPSTKPGFCLSDSEQVLENSTRQSGYYPSTCPENGTMGISAGWADVYFSDIACQYLVIDQIPDGEYVLVVTTNAARKVPEDTFEDNTVARGLSILGTVVSEIPLPSGISSSVIHSITEAMYSSTTTLAQVSQTAVASSNGSGSVATSAAVKRVVSRELFAGSLGAVALVLCWSVWF
jgi:Lysyl oxidase